MARYQVYLETSKGVLEEGGYLAHIPQLIGCVARGKTRDEALDRLRESAAAYREWLKRNGIAADTGQPIEFDVVETEAPIFPPDYEPLREEELDDLFHRIALSRQSLLETVGRLDKAALEWQPEKDSWAVVNILAHLAQADLWYASRLEEGGLPNLLWRLAAARALAVHRLQELPEQARGNVTVHAGEEWTPRKVSRRMIEHEQEHLEQIKEILGKYARQLD
jgi:predicted RNase H-like HicB family nuclease/uncharacterized damage-inducible protein DinB